MSTRPRRALRKYGPDLTSQIESLIDLVGELPAGLDGLFALAFGEGRQQRWRMHRFNL
jgi:hypothetical protein